MKEEVVKEINFEADNSSIVANMQKAIIDEFGHYPLTDKEEVRWSERFKTDFRARENEKLSAVVRELDKVSVTLKLNNGTKDGKVQTVSVSLGSLNTDRYDDQKAMNIKELLEPVLSKSVYTTQETKTSTLTSN